MGKINGAPGKIRWEVIVIIQTRINEVLIEGGRPKRERRKGGCEIGQEDSLRCGDCLRVKEEISPPKNSWMSD